VTWSKVDDGLHDHPKVDAMLEADERQGAAALGLWVMALSYSADQLTDGEITRRAVQRLLPAHGISLAALLVEHGLWDQIEGGWRISGFLDCNPAGAEIRARRRADAERKAAARARHVSERTSAGTSKRTSAGTPKRTSERNPNGHPDTPSRPVPSPTTSLVGGADAPPTVKTPQRADVDGLCRLLAECIIANDAKAKVAPDSQRWRDACRLLIDDDGRTVDEITAVIRWVQADDFWRSNVLSMPTLRDKFTQLAARSQANGTQPRNAATVSKYDGAARSPGPRRDASAPVQAWPDSETPVFTGEGRRRA